MDLTRIEAERRRLAGEPEPTGAADVAERIVAEVLAGQRDVDEVEVPDDARALFEDERPVALRDDDTPEAWAKRIVSDVLEQHSAGATAAPIIDPERPLDLADRAEPRELAEDHRAYWALLGTDEPLALLPGKTVEPDGPAWAPVRDRELEAAIDRVVSSFELTPEPEPLLEADLDLDTAGAAAVSPLGWSAGRTAAWVLLAVIWVAAAASIVPLAFEGTEAAVDFTFDIWGDR